MCSLMTVTSSTTSREHDRPSPFGRNSKKAVAESGHRGVVKFILLALLKVLTLHYISTTALDNDPNLVRFDEDSRLRQSRGTVTF
jgi:hypothetical protein